MKHFRHDIRHRDAHSRHTRSSGVLAALATIAVIASGCWESAQAAPHFAGLGAAGVSGKHQANTVLIASKKKPKQAKRNPRNGDQLIGRAPNPLAEILGGIALGALGVGGGSGGCAVDYTTPNPTSCRVSRYRPSEEPVQRPQKLRRKVQQSKGATQSYTCFNRSGVRYQTRTYKLGCYASDMDKSGSRPSDNLRNIK